MAASRTLSPVSPDSAESVVGVAAAGNGDEIDEQHPAEEARLAKPARDPGAPTRAEYEAHQATHLPYRSWCEECVSGRRDNPAHRAIQQDPDAVPEVAFDYAFVRRDNETETATILIMKDRGSRALRAWVMPNKRADVDGAADRIAAACSARSRPSGADLR